jgi:hypothetical protein
MIGMSAFTTSSHFRTRINVYVENISVKRRVFFVRYESCVCFLGYNTVYTVGSRHLTFNLQALQFCALQCFACLLIHAGFLSRLCFDAEDAVGMFLRKVR